MNVSDTTRRKAGAPRRCPSELAMRVIQLRDQGLSYERIATQLNDNHVPTIVGNGRWYKSYVFRLLHTHYVREIRNEMDSRHGSGTSMG